MTTLKLINKILFLTLIAFTPLAAFSAEPNPDTAFMSLADDYIDNFYLPNAPSAATLLGIHKYDDKIEDYSAAATQKDIAQLKTYESKVTAINPNKLSSQVQGDYDLILSNIRSQLLTLQEIQNAKKDPDLYSSTITNDVFVIMERKFAPADERLRSVIAREKLMPALLKDARNNLINPPKIYTEIALEQLPGIIQFFQQDVPSAFKEVTDPNLQKQFTASNAAVVAALQDYQTWLKTYLLPRSNGDFRLGAETFRKKLLYDEMVDISLDKLIQIGEDNLKKNQQELVQVAKAIDPNKTPQEVLNDMAKDYPAPDKLLATFSASLDHLIEFINDKHLITIPSKVKPILEETPPFLRAITFASMDIPGPFETTANEAYFNVTIPEKSWDAERVKEFMAGFSYPVISSVSVHEAYPGHYVQFLWVKENPDRVRKIFGASTNDEGWAHYCEQMMLDQGLGKDKGERAANILRLGYLQEALLRNARFLVSLKMHTGQLSFEQAQDFFVQNGYQTKTVALVETKRGTVDPMYLYYTLGKLEILKLRADLQKKQGAAFNLGQFHNDFMKQGFPPIKIVRRAMLGDDSPTL